MSLINQLLKDLENRHAAGAEIKGIAPQARSLPDPRSRSRRLVGFGVLGISLVLIVVGLYQWQGRVPRLPAIDLPPPPAPVADKTDHPAPVAPAAQQAPAVEDALLTPVFQLSQELSFVPQPPAPAQPEPERERRESAPKPNKVAAPSKAAAPVRTKPSAKVEPPAKSEPATRAQASTAPASPASAAAPETASGQATSVAAAPVAKPSAAPAPAHAASRPEEVEEVVIGADLPSAPIAKQTRELTAYERAEGDFRKGIARLRQGRLGDAEASFRDALREDRSHLPARQALVGILVESGRNADAESVIREALAVNPRQPRHAMLLARLELDRGDAAGAIRTLEAVKPYAGVDAEFYAFYAATLQRAGRHAEAADYYRSALSVVPGNAVWLMGLGISLRASEQFAEAREAFRRAAETRSLNPELQRFVEAQFAELGVVQR